MGNKLFNKENVPEKWEKKTLGEIVEPTRPRIKPSDKPQLPFIGMDHIEAQTMRLLGTVPASTMKSSAVHFQPGDVLYGRLRPYLNKVYRPNFEGLCSAEFIVFPEREGLDNKFLQYFLNSSSFVSFASQLNTGDRPRVKFEQLAPVIFPLPPLEKQKQIIEEIDKHFSRLDEAVANLKRVKANLKRYKAAVLKTAVEGKLTEEWRKQHPDVEPASKLLERILAERRQKWEETEVAKMKAKGKNPKNDKWKKKYKEPAGPDISDLPELPEGWEWTSIGQAFEVCIGATPSRKKSEYWEGGIPWVSSGEVAFCRIKSTRESISELGLQNTSTQLHPIGTILLGMIGEGKTRGQVAILDIDACNNQNSAAIRVSDTEVSPEYVYSFLEGEYEKTRKRGSGGNQPALNKSRVQQITFPLSPLSEQNTIVLETQRRLSNIENLESMVSSNLLRVKQLRQTILGKAFSGKFNGGDT